MSTAIRIHTTGGPDVLSLEQVELGEPAEGQALVEVRRAGVNFIDTYHRSGLYPVSLPFVPGMEGSGVVLEVGDGVSSTAPGARVAWAGVEGSYSDRIVVPTDSLLTIPDDMTLDTAAAMPVQGMTAHFLTSDTYPLGDGDRCLIHAAAGGTGRLLVQIAKLRGAEVVATVGTEAKAELARSAGADHVIVYSQVDLVPAIEAAVGPESIDVVYDGVGAATFDAGLAVLRPRGTMVTFGNASGPVPPVPPLTLASKSLYLTRPTLFDHIANRGDLDRRWSELTSWFVGGELDVMVGHTFALSDARDAHVALESRSTTGKILLSPSATIGL